MLKQASMPNIISLAGGLPAPDSFPVAVIRKLTQNILDVSGHIVLQYGTTDGFERLKNALIDYRKKDLGSLIDECSIQITTGSQQALDLIGKAFVNPGDYIAVDTPTYLGALQAFGAYSPRYIPLESDAEGPTVESVVSAMKKKIAFMYLVTDFANPSGKTISHERRKQIATYAKKYDCIIVEDSPYRELRYKGTSIPPLFNYAPHHTLYLGSFSKILAPGLRIGYVIGDPRLVKYVTIAKQGTDLFTSGLDQAIAAEYIHSGAIGKHVPKIVSLYKPKLDAMTHALETYFPKDASWTHPEGGMFVWATVRETIDAARLLERTLKRNVAFVPGRPFYPATLPPHIGINTMRLNFTNASVADIEKAIRIIGEEIKKM
jgi:2-aminoadipate transaminase